ncbi:MAG: 3-oxoacyl-ACP synthase [Bacteroidota bacterium]
MSKLYINKQVKLLNNTVYINREKEFSVDSNETFLSFAKSVYKNYHIKYSKFYKMDELSKLGFLAAEIILRDAPRDSISSEEIAIVLANSSASLHTDNKYQKTLTEIPSPSVFVYTLPNIVSGEICIRNDIKGESLFFIQEEFDTLFFNNYINYLFENTNTKLSITGWVEMKMNGDYQTYLYLISRNEEGMEFNETNLKLK